MPPKSKFTKEEITDIALKLVEREGLEALTARSLGKEAGSSARPIFTLFSNMDEVKEQVRISAKKFYNRYVEEGLKNGLPFKGVGISYVRFAKEHPKLFRLLFMSERTEITTMNGILGVLDDNFEKILNSITKTYSVDIESAKKMYFHLWIYTHGIAVLTVSNVCKFSEDEISELLTYQFVSIYKKIIAESEK